MQYSARLTRNRSGLSSNTDKSYHCLIEKETLPILYYITPRAFWQI